MLMKQKHTFSVIVETENLGMVGFEELEESLDSIKAQQYPIEQLEEVVLIVGGHLSSEVLDTLRKQYPWVRVHMEPTGLDYARSKMKGAEVAKGSVLIFADSDMQYEPAWLGNMIKTFLAQPEHTIVSGDTRLNTISGYSMALNCTWMIQILNNNIAQPVPMKFFPLNNFVIAKADMQAVPLPYQIHLYRNKIPLWEAMLQRKGYHIVRAPHARGHHAPPGTPGDWWYRMLVYGADFVAQADFLVTLEGKLVERRNLRRRLQRLLLLAPWKGEQLLLNSYKLLSEDFGRVRYLPGALMIGLVNCLVVTLGGIIACFKRDWVFYRITSREEAHIV